MESSVRFHACRAARRTSHLTRRESRVKALGGAVLGGVGRDGEAAHVELGARGEPLGFLLLVLCAKVVPIRRHVGAEHLVASDRVDLLHLP